MEYGSRLAAHDSVIVDRAATIIALELSAERRAAAARNDELESLASDLLRGDRDVGSLRRRADFLGVPLGEPHALCLLASNAAAGMPAARRVVQAFDSVGCRALVTGVTEGVVAIVQLDPVPAVTSAMAAAKRVVAEACSALSPDGSIVAAISTPCRGPADYTRAYSEARQVLRCLETFRAGRVGVLAATDLGIGRLLLGSRDRQESVRFAEDVLGPLLDDGARTRDLLLTAACFLECGRSVRRSATRLDVHENTIRYRLARLEEVLGLDVSADPDAQLSVQLALLILRLDGRLPADEALGVPHNED
jgi:sugar diacid utilization regulator